MIERNLRAVRERLQSACERAGRPVSEVTLVAVTKQVEPSGIIEAVRCGIRDIGENKVQEAQGKFPSLGPPLPSVRRHMIGHLQGNKVGRAVELFDCIQSVDSPKRLQDIDRRAAELGKTQECLVELKVSDEASKSGLPPEDLGPLLESAQKLSNVKVSGIMCIPPFFEDPSQVRPYFARAKELADRHFAKPVLSMGMSHDFEIAVEEGSTMIRVGTAIFGERRKVPAA